MKTIYRIFPSIGIARLGNSKTTYFLGPESPGIVPQGPYRDESSPGKIKPQAARFRVYEFRRDEFGEETVTRELIPNAKIRIKWSVHLVNRKAAAGQFPPSGPSAPLRNDGYDRAGLVIDAGVQSRSGKNKAALTLSGDINFIRDGNVEASERVQLGRILTDEEGRLIVVGGPGKSGSPIGRGLDNFANNDGWYDGVSDGPVSALIEVGDEEPVLAEGGAWVVIAPPSYGPGIENVTTWYDQALNVNAGTFSPHLMKNVPSFTHDIYPILKRTVLISWVVEQSNRHHGGSGNFLNPGRLRRLADKSAGSRASRQGVFNKLMKPNTRVRPNTAPLRFDQNNMPYVYSGLAPNNPSQGEFAALTNYQYAMMEKWSHGEFHADWVAEPTPVPLDDLPLDQQPHALTRAALEGCIGAPFFPGIEVTYVVAQARRPTNLPSGLSIRYPPAF